MQNLFKLVLDRRIHQGKTVMQKATDRNVDTKSTKISAAVTCTACLLQCLQNVITVSCGLRLRPLAFSSKSIHCKGD